MKHTIPLFHPPRQDVDRMLKELRSTLSSRWWGQGPKVDLFEKVFGEKFGYKYCVMVNSGTAALHLAYVLAGVRPGSSVVGPVLTCTATYHPVKALGATPVFADVDPETLTIDYGSISSAVLGHAPLKAIVVVHLGGVVATPHMIRNVRECFGVPVIEDAAQALGAKMVGQGDFICFSFQAIKALSTGDGGMLVVKRKEDYERAKRLRWFSIDREEKIRKNWQAWDRRGITFDQKEVGYKFQPTDIDASIGLAALGDFDANQIHRKRLARLYDELLWDAKNVELINTADENVNWLYTVFVKKGKSRDELARVLQEAGVETNVAHVRNDLFTVFGGKRQRLDGMNMIEKRYLCLPLNNAIDEKDVRHVCRVIREAKL